MALVYKAPQEIPDDVRFKYTTVFLAGTIDMGDSEDWQSKFEQMDDRFVIINPRRDDWDSSWHDNSDTFNEQVKWELDNLEKCDVIIMNFEKGSKSPISLLELGLFAKSRKIIVICPDGFYRKGNVRIVCERHKIPLYENLNEFIDKLLKSEYIDDVLYI
jgi:hypothetical protein